MYEGSAPFSKVYNSYGFSCSGVDNIVQRVTPYSRSYRDYKSDTPDRAVLESNVIHISFYNACDRWALSTYFMRLE